MSKLGKRLIKALKEVLKGKVTRYQLKLKESKTEEEDTMCICDGSCGCYTKEEHVALNELQRESHDELNEELREDHE